jgi:arylamine N-acetyltransferase
MKQMSRASYACVANGDAKQLATITNVDGDNWVAVIVDFLSWAVYYFDSGKRPINADLQAAYNWWIDQHHHTEFNWISLPCLQQRDGYNCGLFAANRVTHYINPERFPLLDPQACDNEWLYMLGKILDRHEFLLEVSQCP